MRDTIIIKDTTTSVAKEIAKQAGNNTWDYIFLCIGILIILSVAIYLIRKRQTTERQRIKKKLLENSDVDFDNIINSAFSAQKLYDELKIKCHPDRFQDENLKLEATRIFQEITENKYNYKILIQLKKEAIHKLKI